MKQNTKTNLPYRLTNDYLFRAVFQERPKALEGLCRVVLGLDENDIVSVTLRNPIELGKTIDEKDFILDRSFCNLRLPQLKQPEQGRTIQQGPTGSPGWIFKLHSFS